MQLQTSVKEGIACEDRGALFQAEDGAGAGSLHWRLEVFWPPR